MFAFGRRVCKTLGMAFDYVAVDRDQQFLLPPSLKDWLAEDHLVWFVLDVVARVDTSGLHARHRRDGVGRRAYDPDMLLALLVYAYCTGQRSSRQIERLCEVDVAYRVICANLGPDHTTIARFRQDHQAEAVQLFTDVLMLCAQCGLVSVGVIAIDGTKMAGAASLRANRTRDQIEKEVTVMLAEATKVDAAEDDLFGGDRGDELPVELVDRSSRKARLDAALAELERARVARLVEQRAVAARHAAAEAAAARAGRSLRGRDPAGREVKRAEDALRRQRERETERREQVERAAAGRGRKPSGASPAGGGYRIGRAEARLQRARDAQANRDQQPPRQPRSRSRTSPSNDETRVNLTDPESRIMKNARGWVQGFNAQAAVNEHGVVLAADVTQDATDFAQCQPMIAATQTNLGAASVTEPIGTMLFDAGYLSEANIIAEGPTRLIATGKAWRLRRQQPTSGPPPDNASPIEAMEHRLRTPEGAAIYTKRQHTVEPVFGTIKEQRGYRRFSRRGLRAVQAEWQLITAAHNIVKAYHLRPS